MGNRADSILSEVRREDRRLSLAALQGSYEELSTEVVRFIDECSKVGEAVVNAQDRRMIRSIIQYWVTYRYKHTGSYQLPDLAQPTAAFSEIAMAQQGPPDERP